MPALARWAISITGPRLTAVIRAGIRPLSRPRSAANARPSKVVKPKGEAESTSYLFCRCEFRDPLGSRIGILGEELVEWLSLLRALAFPNNTAIISPIGPLSVYGLHKNGRIKKRDSKGSG